MKDLHEAYQRRTMELHVDYMKACQAANELIEAAGEKYRAATAAAGEDFVREQAQRHELVAAALEGRLPPVDPMQDFTTGVAKELETLLADPPATEED